MATRPPLSVIVPTIHGWEEIRHCLERLLPQAAAVGAEVIVGDASGKPFPSTHPNLRRVVLEGKDVFGLRAALLSEAQGEIVAITEDHCWVEDGWCTSILEALAAHPEAAAVAGSVANASSRRLIDWANFLPTFSPFMRNSPPDRGARVPPPGNVAYRRDELPTSPQPGELEIALPQRLQAAGRIVIEPAMVLWHVQTNGFLGTFTHHYDNGRSTAGLALLGAARPARRHRIVQALRAFPTLVAETVRNTLRRGTPRRARFSLPLAVVVVAAHIAGEIVGALRGPGRSPWRLS